MKFIEEHPTAMFPNAYREQRVSKTNLHGAVAALLTDTVNKPAA